MGRIRSFTAQTPAIVMSVLALALSLGGGAAYAAAHTTSPAAASFSLQKLTLKNGWTSGCCSAGAPRAGVSGGVVYLAGAIAGTSATSSVFARLPLNDRPAHNMWLPVYTLDGTEGSLFIGPDGTMEAFGGSATGFTSLAGVSFPRNS